MLIKLKNIQNDIVQKQSIEIRETLENLRETMCLTSGQLFRDKTKKKIRSIERVKSYEKTPKKEEMKKSQFKIRINSFHRSKVDRSLYDP